MRSSIPHTILTADWSKSEKKHRAVKIDTETLTVESVPAKTAERLEGLLEVAHGTGTLIGIDAVVGIPEYIGRAAGSTSFLDWLEQGQARPGFFEAVDSADDWSPWRPFWKNPSGQGSQKRFFDTILANHTSFPRDHGLRRTIDRLMSGKPPTCTQGMPGTVGSGTAALWKELAATRNLALWPFTSPDLVHLLTRRQPVLVETYPAICYGIVLADRLPGPYIPVAKTQRAVRSEVLGRLTDPPVWEPGLKIAEDLLEAARECEDDFDALFMGLALYRLAQEGHLNHEQSGKSPLPDPIFEGGIVGSWCVLRSERRIASRKTVLAATAQPPPRQLSCPLAGCQHVFRFGRGGWDGHVASVRNHPKWHPEVQDGTARKRLFHAEFPAFFRR